MGGRTFMSPNWRAAIMSLKAALNDRLEEMAPKLWLSLNILRQKPNFGPEYWLLPKLCCKDSIALDIGGKSGLVRVLYGAAVSEGPCLRT